MNFPPLIKATGVKRYKRFLCDVILEDGTEATAHCPNSGRMTTCFEPGAPVYISKSDNPKRKLPYTLEMVEMPESLVVANTLMANRVGKEAVEKGLIQELAGYDAVKAEVTYPGESRSRVDLCLTRGEETCFVEIKSVTLCYDGIGSFPDAPTERGRKHLRELAGLVEQGIRPVVLFIIMRNDVKEFRPAYDIDPKFGKLLAEVREKGVEVLAYHAEVTTESMTITNSIPIVLIS